jgi:hypothetical protein
MTTRLFLAGERLRAASLNRLAAGSTVVQEAPVDGAAYSRQDAGWVVAAAGVPDAPEDGSVYARIDGAWQVVPQRATVETVSATTQTPAVGTDGRYFRCTNAAGCAVTIPANATQAFPVGTMLTYEQVDTDSAVTFTAAGGVTLNNPAAYQASTAEQFAVVQACKVGTDEWTLYGHLLPV